MISLRIPVATYRLQFNRRFRFQDAQTLVPYLHQLGVSDLYASPIFKARLGSPHGYDVTDPSQLNPELGTEIEFKALVQKLKRYKMGLLLDIVPNHMAISPENPWWMDFLENGLCSPYAAFFDIDWSPALENRVLLPILDSPYRKALENQELTLTLEGTGLFVRYHDYRWPLDVKTYHLVLSHRREVLEATLGASHPHFQQLKQLINAMQGLPAITALELTKSGEHYQERQAAKKTFLRMVNSSPEVEAFLLENIALFNGRAGAPGSFKLLDGLLERQVYRLAFWKEAREGINYRRFFDINHLIGLRVEELEVFEATHALLLRLVTGGRVTGLRVDHIDGLYDPMQYLSRLRHYIVPEVKQSGEPPGFYIIVEKVLTDDEILPPGWLVSGTTGYDFLNTVNGLFVDSKGAQVLNQVYHRFTGSTASFDDVAYEKKRQVIGDLFPGEMRTLGRYLVHLAQQSRQALCPSAEELTEVLNEVTACLTVYRTYIRALEVSPRDQLYLEHAVHEAQQRNPNLKATGLDFVKRVLLLDFPTTFTSEQKRAWLCFVLRWQQLTGAVMAKGFEDTALYAYNRLVSLNEVGGTPDSQGLSIEDYHRHNLSRLKQSPYTLNATTTHDTKRSEDVRARINVLSEIPAEWERRLACWSQWNQPRKRKVNGLFVPEPNMEILLYQTLVGAWPLTEEEVPEFKERVKAYMVKATREAKVFTSWLCPNKEYETAVIDFIESILEAPGANDFLCDIIDFQKQVAYYGALNSLAQVLLKITSPGIPDFYQGTELWDLSLVDPDNRRPINFGRRIQLLADLVKREEQAQSLVPELLNSWQDGRIKLYVTYKALNRCQYHRAVFLEGEYIPLQVRGQKQEHVCAFARRLGKTWVIVAVPRLLAGLIDGFTLPLGRGVWGNGSLLFPEGAPKHWHHLFTGETITVSSAKKSALLWQVFEAFPVAWLEGAY
jgi:(1->4)-alpha-D-glucan 1-alpha-D-glucosylmutase